MPAEGGFKMNQTDCLFLRNSGHFLLLGIIIVVFYIFIGMLTCALKEKMPKISKIVIYIKSKI